MNIEQTISLYLDGELTSDQEAEFHHLLSVSPEARSLFREQMALQSVARSEGALLTPEDGLRNSLFGRLRNEGFSADALPSGITPTSGMAAEGTTDRATPPAMTEQVRRRPAPEALSAAPMRSPVANESVANEAVGEGEQKRRRPLIPLLIPVLLLAVAGSILWFDRDSLLSDNTGQNVAAVADRNDSEMTERSAADPEETTAAAERAGTDQLLADASTVESAAPTDRAASTDAAAVEATTESGTRSDDRLIAARTERALDDASVTVSNGPQAQDLEENLPALSTLDENADQPAEVSSLTLLATEVPEPMFASTPAAPTDQEPISVVALTDDNGEPITPLFENWEEILAALRSEGITIGHDGTFSFTPTIPAGPEGADMMALQVVSSNRSSIRFQTSSEEPPQVYVYQETMPEETAEMSRISERNAPVIGSAPFISIEGGLSGNLAATERTITWVQDDPVRQTSSVRGEFLLKGGVQEGSLRLFAVGGLTPFEERSVTYSADAAGPVTPVSSNTITTGREVWAGAGGRYIVRIDDRLATGIEALVGVGTERFHAGLSVPVSATITRGLLIEILPSVRYRNAHRPFRATTGTSPWEEGMHGPAHAEELDFGTSIGLILLLY